MTIKIKYFGILTSHISGETKELDLPVGSTIEEMLDIAFNKDKFEDSVIKVLKSAVFLVNKSIADKSTILKDKDEVIVLNALGGG
ncbi:MAG TPA: MoaD/ThiS family protein [Anaerovoracaceae bacterium]|nr:MoaD/ThiS family protein [Anaerovoracaceae bacterium]